MKTLITLAIGGLFAGAAFAGPNDAYAGPIAGRAPINPKYVTIALFRPGVKSATAEKKILFFNANPKMPGVVEVAR
jgi:hypothetical protein